MTRVGPGGPGGPGGPTSPGSPDLTKFGPPGIFTLHVHHSEWDGILKTKIMFRDIRYET